MKKHLIVMVEILVALTICACSYAPATNPGTGGSAPNFSEKEPTGTTSDRPTPPVTQNNPTETSTATMPVPTTKPIAATTAPVDPTTEPTDPTGPHYCTYLQTETAAATCTEEGYTLYACDCGQNFKAVSDRIPHDYQQTEGGLCCSVCGAAKEDAYPVEEREPESNTQRSG